MKRREELRQALACQEHDRWSRWMRHQFARGTFGEDGSWTMPVEMVERWLRLAATSYALLTEDEKRSDLAEADRILEAIDRHLLETILEYGNKRRSSGS